MLFGQLMGLGGVNLSLYDIYIYIHFFPRLTLVATVVRTQSLFLSHLASMVFNLPCPAG